MPAQQTFTLVPPAGPTARSPAPVRPMTTKQVVKAHKETHRRPRVSRAEQLRQDRAELERIRKEQEKEKASAKARAARQKKKEEEQARLEEKKRNGLPLVDVTASQNVLTSLFFQRTRRDKKVAPAVETLVPRMATAAEESRQRSDPAPLCAPIINDDKDELDLLLEADLDDLDFVELDMNMVVPNKEQKTTAIDHEACGDSAAKDISRPGSQRKRLSEERIEEDLGLSTKRLRAGPVQEKTALVENQTVPGPAQDKMLLPLTKMDMMSPPPRFKMMPPPAPRAMVPPFGGEMPSPAKRPTMPPPPVQKQPVKPRQTPITAAAHNRTIPSLAQKTIPPPAPLSTQFIDDWDDFFPSATQQVRELAEEDAKTPQRGTVHAIMATEKPAALPAPSVKSSTTGNGLNKDVSPNSHQDCHSTVATVEPPRLPASTPGDHRHKAKAQEQLFTTPFVPSLGSCGRGTAVTQKQAMVNPASHRQPQQTSPSLTSHQHQAKQQASHPNEDAYAKKMNPATSTDGCHSNTCSQEISALTGRKSSCTAQLTGVNEKDGTRIWTDEVAAQPASSPKRFFTKTGSQEQVSTALHKSLASARMDAFRHRDRLRVEAGDLEKQQREAEARLRAEEAARRNTSATKITGADANTDGGAGKENIAPSASQESDYGGGWLDNIPLDIEFWLSKPGV
ncbi:hypothetical protein S40288_04001 [Stachybotrys chartarum IBT 40288]|nr:hypothetical protein S40288_04001 [Stachybotrys chartarum IBT 40288]